MIYSMKCQAWYKALMQYPMRYRLYVTLLMVLALLSFWQLLLYRPFGRAIQFYRIKNKDLQLMMHEMGQDREQAAVLSRNIQGLQRDAASYQAQIQDVNEVVALVVKEAIRSNLVLVSCQVEPLSDHDWYQLQSMRIEVRGLLPDLAQWLKKISEQSKLVSVSSLAVVQVDQPSVRCSATIQCIHPKNRA